MSINLSGYTNVDVGTFVKLVCTKYRTTPSGTFTTETMLFSDYPTSVTVDGSSYAGLGRLLGVTDTSSELRPSSQELSITISGIPDSAIAEIVNSKIKGSTVTVYRGIINTSTGQLLSITGNPIVRFKGIVTNYSLNEEYDVVARLSMNSIVITCASTLDVLGNTASGRRTNSQDMKKYYPSDTSFDRITTLIGANFNFGAPT
jgi:hypothetical protein